MSVYLVTGGSGFIGSAFVLYYRNNDIAEVVNLDKLTYAGNPLNLKSIINDAGYKFIKGDIADRPLVSEILNQKKPDAIINFAAESHVDRSILGHRISSRQIL